MKIKEIADYVQTKLASKGYIIHRYDAFSTDSIYLKVDYGVGGSIRIADHLGKKHLNYRFNISIDEGSEGVRIIKGKVCDRRFYSADSVEMLVSDICQFRDERVQRYGGIQRYLYIAERTRADNKGSKVFWENAREIKISRARLVNNWLSKNGIKYKRMTEIVERVKAQNTKLDKLIKDNGNIWEGLPDNHLDLILIRYAEMTGAKEVSKIVFTTIEGLMDIAIK